MILIAVLSFFSGIFVKSCDNARDNASVLFGCLYAVSLGFLALQPEVSGLWIGGLLAMLLANKIDKRGHFVGSFGALSIAVVFSQIKSIDSALFAVALFFGLLDEILHGMRIKFLEHRICLEIAIFVYAALASHWILWLSILLFDAGYFVSGKYLYRKSNN